MVNTTQRDAAERSKTKSEPEFRQAAKVLNPAARKLLEARIFSNLKKEVVDSDVPEFLAEQEKMPQLRMSIPLTMDLAQRLTRIPLMGSSQSKQSLSITQPSHQLSCDSDIGIWHESDDAFTVLRRFFLGTHTARSEFPCIVLWALSKVLPEMYQKLITSDFLVPDVTLIKCVKELPEPIHYDHNEPPFEFNYGNVFGKASIHPTSLVHTFISGATGAGKTYGAVKPLLQSFLIYQNRQGKYMSMLVIDPKSELLQVCKDELSKGGQSTRLVRLGNDLKLQFFRQDCEMGVEERYRMFSSMVQVKTSGESANWQEKGNRLNISMADADRKFQRQTGTNLWAVVRSVVEGRDCTKESQWANILGAYKYACRSRESLYCIACVSHALIQLCPELVQLQSPFENYMSDADLLNQLFYHVSNAEKVCFDLCAPEVCNVISTDLYPQESQNERSIEDLLESGSVMMLQPTSSYFGDVAGRLVKSRFFADVLSRSDMRTPVSYLADECQRFLTSDRETGEQSFLDRCRAYRVNCVLASQSLSSIEHALCNNGDASPRLAVDILVANSPTKIIYRSVDSGTQNALRSWIPPGPAGRMHVVDVRPVSQLPVGSAYYMCDGEWGMYRYKKSAKAN